MSYIIKNKLLELHTTPWGASMTAIWLKDRNGNRINVIYGFKEEEAYRRNPEFLGATCGRYAGRIGGHAFRINGTTYPLDSDGPVHLHGGEHTLGLKKWRLKEIHEGDQPRIVYSIDSPHLEGGYPGNLKAEACYTLEENTLKITYKAISDHDTYLNLTNHNYYNLDGGGTVRDHHLYVNAGNYLETGDHLLPTGTLIDLEGTPLDHRTEKPLKQTFTRVLPDHTFVLNDTEQEAARLFSPTSGVELKLFTNQPAVVVYTPEELHSDQYQNSTPGKYPSLCLEAQQFPNAPNEPKFPSALLKKGEHYQNDIHLEFAIR